MDKCDKRISNYTSNKSIICGVVLGQCDTSMQSKLAITAGREAKKSDLLFILKQHRRRASAYRGTTATTSLGVKL